MKRTNGRAIGLITLTNDPSITAWGWAVLTINGTILESGCIKTEPKSKKLRIRKGDDTTRRVREINKELLAAIKKHKVNFIISELPHGSQSASAAIMIGLVTGIMQTIADVLDIGIEWYSEGDAKNAALGKQNNTKLEMIEAMNKLYDVDWTGIKYKDEAIADALAIHNVAKKQSETLKLYSKLVK